MNLNEIMRSGTDLKEQNGKPIPDLNSTTPRSNQPSPERELISKQSETIRHLEKELTVRTESVRALQEQITKNETMMNLLKTEIAQKTDEIQKNSSDISLLKNELQEKSETIVSLNEKIVTLNESDKELQRSEQLLKQSEEMRSNALAKEREAARMISAAERAQKEAQESLFAERNCLRREFEECKHKLEREYRRKLDSYRLRSFLGWGVGIMITLLYVITSEWFVNDVTAFIKALCENF